MACDESDKNCFTFMWNLENASYFLQKNGTRIVSPAFGVDEIQKTKWKLGLYPRGNKDENYISYFLTRELDSSGDGNVEIKYKLDFISKDGVVLKEVATLKHSFHKGNGYGYPSFLRREDLFIINRSKFLPENNLLARCRIWKSDGDMAENVQCYARTRIGVEKRSFVWDLKDFTTLEPEKVCTYPINSLEDDTLWMSVNLSMTGGQICEESLNFKLTCHDPSLKFCALHVSLVNVSGKLVECNQEEFWFDNLTDSRQFTFLYSRQKLMRCNWFLLPGNILSMYWECAFSKGKVFEGIDEVRRGRIIPKSKSLFTK